MTRAFKITLCVLVLLPFTALPAFSAGKLGLKIATLAPEGTSLTRALREASDEISKATDGRVYLKLYSGGSMGTEATCLQKTYTGQLHGLTLTSGSGGIATLYNDFQVLSLPMLIRNSQEADAVGSAIEGTLMEGLADKGFICTGIAEIGFAHLMSKYPLRDKKDLEGRKMWMPEVKGVGSDIFSDFGFNPIPMGIMEVMVGLQTGMIDTVANSPVGAIALQWFSKVKYVTEPAFCYTYATLAFSKKSWDKVPEQDREKVFAILQKCMRKVAVQNRVDNQKAIDALKKNGLVFIQATPEASRELEATADSIIDKLQKNNFVDPALLSRARSAVRKVRESKPAE